MDSKDIIRPLVKPTVKVVFEMAGSTSALTHYFTPSYPCRIIGIRQLNHTSPVSGGGLTISKTVLSPKNPKNEVIPSTSVQGTPTDISNSTILAVAAAANATAFTAGTAGANYVAEREIKLGQSLKILDAAAQGTAAVRTVEIELLLI